MMVRGASALVTGGASGLGRATAEELARRGAIVTILDLPTSAGAVVAEELSTSYGADVRFASCDVTDEAAVEAAVEIATRSPLRIAVHCAGRGATVRLVNRDGSRGSTATFKEIVELNLVGTFNVLSACAQAMVGNDPVEGERGVCILTASVAAWEGQVGQLPYASSKAGVVGMTLVAARDLASRAVRVNAIAPGIFDTPILSRLGPEVIEGLARQVPNPARLGQPEEFARLATSIVENGYLNGETIRLDGAVRMGAR